MTKLALRGMAERKLRSALTAIAVLLGVAMISGTYVLTDGIRGAFAKINETANEGTDAVLSPKTEFNSSFTQTEKLPASLVAPGARAAPGGEGGGRACRRSARWSWTASRSRSSEGRTWSSAPRRSRSTPPPRRRGGSLRARARSPSAATSPTSTGSRSATGSASRPRTGRSRSPWSGLVDFGGSGSAAGYGFTMATPGDDQRWYDQRGEVGQISVAAKPGVTPEQLVRAIQAIVPPGVKVQTGQQNADEQAKQISNSINSFLGPALLAFAGAALLVGAFIIFNTFSISVAERTREFASLRTLGATRGQVLRSVAIEALTIGADRLGRRALRRDSPSPRGSARSSRPPAPGYRPAN